ncbi:MAG: hypothetical protein AB1584_17585 [Pseudomonadota bacterium]
MIDIEQGHRNEAELSHIAVQQAPRQCEKAGSTFRKYNSTIG